MKYKFNFYFMRKKNLKLKMFTRIMVPFEFYKKNVYIYIKNISLYKK